MDKSRREKTHGILALVIGMLISLKAGDQVFAAWLAGIYLIVTGILTLAK